MSNKEKVEEFRKDSDKTFKLKRYRAFGIFLALGLMMFPMGLEYASNAAWGILFGIALSQFDAYQ